jgi:hypothetical protein
MEDQNCSTSNTSAPPPILTTHQAAIFLNLKPATLEQWRWTGRGPRFIKIGRSCRYRISDLEAFLESRVFNSTTEAQNGEVIA